MAKCRRENSGTERNGFDDLLAKRARRRRARSAAPYLCAGKINASNNLARRVRLSLKNARDGRARHSVRAAAAFPLHADHQNLSRSATEFSRLHFAMIAIARISTKEKRAANFTVCAKETARRRLTRPTIVQQFSFTPERGCVVSTSRSISAKPKDFLVRSLLRLVLRIQPRSEMKIAILTDDPFDICNHVSYI